MPEIKTNRYKKKQGYLRLTSSLHIVFSMAMNRMFTEQCLMRAIAVILNAKTVFESSFYAYAGVH